jgi:uncharacterized protein (TIGR03663 family)
MKWPEKCCILILLVVIVALALRLPRLANRPMHGDEAVNAVKFGQLLEERFYRYDPHEYHGPTLNYLTLVPAWLTSAQKLSEIGEFTLRIVPVFFGILLVLMPLLLTDGLGKPAAVLAALFTAVSPAMVFYSRYYIHEMLLVCFTFGVIICGYRYTRSKNIAWAVLTGLFCGLMYATKETCIIAFACMFLAFLLTSVIRRQQGTTWNIKKEIIPVHIIAAVASAVIISVLFYSSFFTNPTGVLDSFRAYSTYFGRAGRDVSHVHPSYYYLKMLIYSKYSPGPAFSEALIIILAAIGFVVAMTKKSSHTANSHLLRFIAFYTLITAAIYSAIGYKTPWCMLTFLHGMTLLAAVGAAATAKLQPSVLRRTVISLILVAGSVHLAWQAYLASYKFSADPCNPYVYAHPTADVLRIAQRVERIARIHPDGRNVNIQVICPYNDYWPLPWYLRRLTSVGWYDKVDDSAPIAPLIIASPAVESALSRKLYETPPGEKKNLYVPMFETYMELRPQVEIRAFVTKDLWDSFQVMKDGSTGPG